MTSNFQLLGVDFKAPPGYEKSSDPRIIRIESENCEISEINLENGREPTIKLFDGTVLSKGSRHEVSLDKSAKSISTTEKYSQNSYEFTIFVQKFVDFRQVCRALKNEVDKYTNVIPNSKTGGYEANTDDGKHILCYVQKQCLVIITGNDTINIDDFFKKPTNKIGLIQLIVGIFLLLFDLFAILKAGFNFRILFLLVITSYLLYGGYNNLKLKEINCPKFKLN